MTDMVVSEWIKLRSVRSTYWLLLVAAVTALGASVVIGLSARRTPQRPPDPVAWSFLGWLEYPVLAIGIVGVLVFTAEFTTGQIRTTFTAVPRRLTVVAAKTAVTGAAALVFGELLAFASFLITQAGLGRRGVSLSHPGVAGAVLAAGFVLVVVAVLGLAFGAIVRHTAGAIAALPAVFYLPLVLMWLPAPWDHRLERFTLPAAAYQVVALHPAANLFAPAISVLVLLAWPAIALVAAAITITRRDV